MYKLEANDLMNKNTFSLRISKTVEINFIRIKFKRLTMLKILFQCALKCYNAVHSLK